MKKLLSLLLALTLCFGLFAACADKPEDNVSPDTPPVNDKDDPSKNPDDAKNPDDPSTPDKLTPGMQADGVTFVGVLDMTDDYTMVIEKANVAREERNGLRSESGKVSIGSYTQAGSRRNNTFTLDWASLGLEGAPYEYLGSTFILDVSDKENPKLKNTPEKTTWCVLFSDITIAGTVEENNVTYTMPDGKVFNLSDLIFGYLSANNLINDSSKYLPQWNDKSANIPNLFKSDYMGKDYTKDYYMFTQIPLYEKYVVTQIFEAPSGYTGTLSPNQATATPAQ